MATYKPYRKTNSAGTLEEIKIPASSVDGLSTVATSGSYNDLADKPTIPTVNNGTLTIQKNGTNVQTFSANQSGNATANITVPTKVSQLTNDSGYTANKGTVTQVKINGTTKSPNSAGLVDLGTISGGGDNPLSTIELVAGDSIQVASPSAEGASYVKIIGATDLGQAETLEIDVFFTYASSTRTILHKEITLDTSSKSVISLEFATVQDNAGYPIFIIKLSYGAVVETDYSTFGYRFDSITGVGFSYEDQANQSSIFTGIMIKEVEP